MDSQGWILKSSWDTNRGSLLDHIAVKLVDEDEPEPSLAQDNGGEVVLIPGPEKGSCELTVQFQERSHRIHHIHVLSSAKTCEVYSQSERDDELEYVCTVRATRVHKSEHPGGLSELAEEELSRKALLEAEIGIEDAELCKSVTVKLLSLEEKSQVNIRLIVISVSPGQFLAGESSWHPPNAMLSGMTLSSSLGPLGPAMLQMAQGISISQNRNSAQEAATVKNDQNDVLSPPDFMQGLMSKMVPSALAGTAVSEESASNGAFLEVCQRLDRLEAVCVRIETSLTKALESFERRLQLLEGGLNT